MTMRGGVSPADESSVMWGRGKALAAYCLCGVVSLFLMGEEMDDGEGVLVALEQFFDGGIGRHGFF